MANSPRKPKPKRPESEADIQRTIKGFLELHGYMVWRNQSGKVKSAHGGWMQLSPPGSPDLYALKAIDQFGQAFLVGIECKKPGEDQSPEQVAFQREFEEHGGEYVLARDLKDVLRLK